MRVGGQALDGEVGRYEQAEQRDELVGGAMGLVSHHALALIQLLCPQSQCIAAYVAQPEIASTKHNEWDDNKRKAIISEVHPEHIKSLPGRVPDVPQGGQAAKITQAKANH